MNKISIKGILVGGVVDIVGTNILTIPLIMYIVNTHGLAQTPAGQIQSAITEAIHGSVVLLSAQILIGSICSVLGGYVAARLAKHDELLNGGLSAFLCVAIGIYSITSGKVPHSLSLQVLDLILAPALGILGGYFSSISKRRGI